MAKEEELIPVDEPIDEKIVLDEDDEDDGDDEPIKRSEEEDSAETDEERAKIRERRRLEKKERKERRTQAISRDRIELDFLRKRNDELERRMTSVEVRSVAADTHGLQRQLGELNNEVQLAERVIAKAVEAGNGEDVAKALRYRDEALKKSQQLEMTINQYRAHQQQMEQPKEPTLDPVTIEHAKSFFKDHPWYDTSGKDEDSAIVLAIDNSLTKEGYVAQSEAYWNELRQRVKKRLPEKFEEPTQRRSSGGPQLGSGKEHAPTSSRREVYISPERKAALIEAGVWDDPILRQRYIKKYMEYDKVHG